MGGQMGEIMILGLQERQSTSSSSVSSSIKTIFKKEEIQLLFSFIPY
jgi:hypothetical protein